ncbi:MAG: hypothetical protein ACKV0T_19600 [Planctomycetales bacterium]
MNQVLDQKAYREAAMFGLNPFPGLEIVVGLVSLSTYKLFRYVFVSKRGSADKRAQLRQPLQVIGVILYWVLLALSAGIVIRDLFWPPQGMF